MPAKRPNHKAATNIDKFVGGRIRMARITANMSQEQLGTKLGVSFQQVQKYEKGSNRVSAGRLSEIAVSLGQTVQWFLDEPEEAVARMQDDVLTKMLSKAHGRELALNFLASKPAVQHQLTELSRTMKAA